MCFPLSGECSGIATTPAPHTFLHSAVEIYIFYIQGTFFPLCVFSSSWWRLMGPRDFLSSVCILCFSVEAVRPMRFSLFVSLLEGWDGQGQEVFFSLFGFVLLGREFAGPSVFLCSLCVSASRWSWIGPRGFLSLFVFLPVGRDGRAKVFPSLCLWASVSL